MQGQTRESSALSRLLKHLPGLTADLSELDLPSSVKISFPNGKEKIMCFDVVLTPDEGMYRWAGGLEGDSSQHRTLEESASLHTACLHHHPGEELSCSPSVCLPHILTTHPRSSA